MARKTVINNLIIIWQGQSWSVLAPDGEVLGRFPDKDEAIRYAESNTYYVHNHTTTDGVFDGFFEKPKRGYDYATQGGGQKRIALYFAIIATSCVALTLAGRELVMALQAGIATVDWGALILQVVVTLVAALAALIAVITVGSFALSLITMAAIVLGILGACGLITSFLFGWPWTL